VFVVFALINLTQVGQVVIFLVTLSILVVLHEYGHFLVARRNGVRVNEFAVGMGPKIFGWTSPKSGTLYSFRALPIGGFCAMEGEDNTTSEAEQAREFAAAPIQDTQNFQAKSPWKRLAIVAAGPVANFILAYVILLGGIFAFGVQSNTLSTNVVAGVIAGSIAEKIGLKAGDAIVAIDGQTIASGDQLLRSVHGALRKPITVTYREVDSTRTVTKSATPQPCPASALIPAHSGCLGFSPLPTYVHVGVVGAIAASGPAYVNMIDNQIQNVGLIVTHFTQYASQIRGPIGIGQAAVQIQGLGWAYYINLAALLSFALGFFNLLPLPALDGGRGAFIIAELLRGKPVAPEREAMVHIAGFAVLMVLMVVIAVHDISRIVTGGGALN
jgi:regulator of sigma E protease